MKTFSKYLSEAMQPTEPISTRSVSNQAQIKQVKNIETIQNLKKQVYNKYGQPGTDIDIGSKQEIINLYKQKGEDISHAPIAQQQGTNKIFIV